MTDINNNQLQEILNDLMVKFNDLPPIIEQNPTFLEITEYPHYENVCSNILRFYFDTSQPHGLKNLLLKSLFQAIDKPLLAEHLVKTERENVNREVRTDNAKRIDLLIQIDNYIIVIENKIYHHLTNQLADYQIYVNTKHQKLTPLYVLLAPEKIIAQNLPETLNSDRDCLNDDAEKGFKSITFKELFDKVKINLGEFIQSADTKYLTYFTDFMTSIENLNKSMTINPELVKFVTENEENIKNIKDAHDKVWNQIYEKVKKVKSGIIEPFSDSFWVFDKCVLVYDVDILNNNESINIGLSCWFSLKFVSIEVYINGNKIEDKHKMLKDLFSFLSDDFNQEEKTNRGFIIYKNPNSPFEIDNLQIITKLNEILPQFKISE